MYGTEMILNPCPRGYVLAHIGGNWMCVLEGLEEGVPFNRSTLAMQMEGGHGPGGPFGIHTDPKIHGEL